MPKDFSTVDIRKFGAVGDGVTDDSTVIQAAIDYAAQNSFAVYAPAGTYRVQNIVLPSYVSLTGAGIETTIFKLTDNSTRDVFISKNFSSLTGTNSNGGVSSVELRDFKIVGNRQNATKGGWGLRKYGYRWVISDVKFVDCNAGGIYTEWGVTTGAAADTDFMEDYWNNVRVYSCNQYGIQHRGPHDSRFNNILVYGIMGAPGIGLLHEQSGTYTSTGTVLSNVHVYGCTGDGIQLNVNTFGNQIESESNAGSGVVIKSSMVALSDVTTYVNNIDGIRILSNDVLVNNMYSVQNRRYGISLGDVGVPVTGVMINGKSLNNSIAQLNFANDVGGNQAQVVTWNNTGQVTTVGKMAADTSYLTPGAARLDQLIINPFWNTAMGNNTLFVDIADNRLKFKDNAGITSNIGRFVNVPATSSAAGSKGDWSADASYLYMCYATNSWRRVALAKW